MEGDESMDDPVNEASASEDVCPFLSQGSCHGSARSLGHMEMSNQADILMHSIACPGSNDILTLSEKRQSKSLPYFPVSVNEERLPNIRKPPKVVHTEAARRLDSPLGSPIANASSNSHQSLAGRSSSNISNLAADSIGPSMNVAKNRLLTFQKFWSRKNDFTNIRLLVAYGFYCVGQGDAVECFFCHVVIANWNRNDDPRARHIENSPQCNFISGHNCGNVPLPTQVRRNLEERLNASSRRRSRHRPSSAIPQLCPGRAGSYMNATFTETEKYNLLQTFPCVNPANPSMRGEQARLDSLSNSNFRLNTRLRASNETVAKAGFYSDGESDKTRCWFCDGGLKDYEEDDDPWVEHAKYYPKCEYLAQQRGPAWVHEISMRNPNIQRPIWPTREGEVLPQSQASSSIFVTYPTDLPMITRDTTQAILDEAMQSASSRDVISMGFEEEIVKNAQNRKIMETGSYYETREMLLDAILDNDRQQDIAQNRRNVIDFSGRTIRIRGGNFSGRNVINGVLYNTPVSHGAEEFMDETYHNPNQRHVFNNISRNVTTTPEWSSSTPLSSLSEIGTEALRNERGCKICYTNMADILFMPCRHISACAPCSRRVSNCPVCRVRITNTIQVYHA